MSAISDEIRKVADEYDVTPLYGLADRIDAEMVELPRDKDGRPITAGDVVYGDDGRAWRTYEIVLLAETESGRKFSVKAVCDDGAKRGLRPEWLSHERPDSFERIADEIDHARAWCDVDGKRPTPVSSISNGTLHYWADRIRKLAEKEGER